MKNSIIKASLSISGLLILVLVYVVFLVNSTMESTSDPINISLHSGREVSLLEKERAIDAIARPYNGMFELPLKGSTGYAPVEMAIKEQANQEADTIKLLDPGDGFRIIKEEGEWWLIEDGMDNGWIQHRHAFINLPDIIPSIIYDNTNAYSSIFQSSEEDIPEVTNEMLYSGFAYNERLEKEEFVMPVLYSMSEKIYQAQNNALENDDTLVIYEAYRPHRTQEKVAEELINLADANSQVREGINTPPWGVQWFIAGGISNHQRGYAIDVSLASVESKETVNYGNYTVEVIESYEEYQMPTTMHELSAAAVVFTDAVTSKNDDAWRGATLTDTMTEGAIKLQEYSTNAGLTPLASEWWHFNDLDARDQVISNSSNGRFVISDVFSIPPIN